MAQQKDSEYRVMEYSNKVPPAHKIINDTKMLVVIFPDKNYDDILISEVELIPAKELQEFYNINPVLTYRVEHSIHDGKVLFRTLNKENKEIRADNLSDLLTLIYL